MNAYTFPIQTKQPMPTSGNHGLRIMTQAGVVANQAHTIETLWTPAQMDCILGVHLYGSRVLTTQLKDAVQTYCAAKQLPNPLMHQVDMPVLAAAGGSPNCLVQTLVATEPVKRGHLEGIRYAHSRDYLFGVIQPDPGMPPINGGLQTHAEDCYHQIFTLLRKQQNMRLWRVWNYLAEINDTKTGLEIYRQFNLGRYTAFNSQGYLAQLTQLQQIPAACALGIPTVANSALNANSRLSISLLASNSPFIQLENPRQISAYDYPSEYGPKSPTFSRAILGLGVAANDPKLFISGTASIVGHHTLHSNNVAEQTNESLRNIEALCISANKHANSPSLNLRNLQLMVYIRHQRDYPQVQAALEDYLTATHSFSSSQVNYVLADICRQDLLVEIEAHFLAE